MLYRFEVRVCEEVFAKRGLGGSAPSVSSEILLRLKEKISPKGRSIDDSNEYKFIYVPSASSSEKKNIFDDRWVFNFLPAKV